MRRAVTLTDEVNALIRQAMAERGQTIGQVVDEAIINAVSEPSGGHLAPASE